MLDVKSFMKLAMTSKDMYSRCMKDNSIRINVDVNNLEVRETEKSKELRFSLSNGVRDIPFQKLPCKTFVRCVSIYCDIEASKMPAFYSYMKEIRVDSIYKLIIHYLEDLVAITAIIKDFGVKSMNIHCDISENVIRSSLQLNLEKLRFKKAEPFDSLLEIDTSIREIYCAGLPSQVQLTAIISKIQSGSLFHVFVNLESIDRCDFEKVAANKEGPFPETRPLLLTAEPYVRDFREYWFLHADGGVTKCETDDSDSYLTVYKCEEYLYPWILRKEEVVFKDFENRIGVSCTLSQFHTFYSRFTMLESSYDGPLPENRPLYVKIYEEEEKVSFWRLDEGDNLMECCWEEGFGYWEPLEYFSWKTIDNPAIAKHVFWKVVRFVKENKREDRESILYCKDAVEFGSWFDKFENLDPEYSGSWPRPLVFRVDKSSYNREEYPEVRFVLIEDRVVECSLSDTHVKVRYCTDFTRLGVVFTAKAPKEQLKALRHEDMYLNVQFTIFRELILETTATEFWFASENGVSKVVRENGHLILFKSDLCDSPPVFMKQAFKYFAEKKRGNFTLELGQFYSCLEQFPIIPFDCSGRLKPGSPLAFVKNETHHTCRKGADRRVRCDCTDLTVLVWFLWNGITISYCSWGKGEPKKVLFDSYSDFKDVPQAMKSKEYLKNLILGKFESWNKVNWFGRFNDFITCLDEFIRFPFNYNARLPNDRPLAFDNYPDEQEPAYFILRKDGKVIQCKKKSATHFLLTLSSDKESFPPALKNLF